MADRAEAARRGWLTRRRREMQRRRDNLERSLLVLAAITVIATRPDAAEQIKRIGDRMGENLRREMEREAER